MTQELCITCTSPDYDFTSELTEHQENLSQLELVGSCSQLHYLIERIPSAVHSLTYNYIYYDDSLSDVEKQKELHKALTNLSKSHGGTLKHLELQSMHIRTLEFIAILKSFTSLESLILINCGVKIEALSESVLESIAPHCKSLKNFRMEGAYDSVGDYFVDLLQICPVIENVKLKSMKFSSAQRVLQINTLKYLDLSRAKDGIKSKICFEDFEVLSSESRLQELRLADVQNLGDWKLTRLLSKCPSLISIDLSRCNMSDYAINLLFALPNLKKLRLDENDICLAVNYEKPADLEASEMITKCLWHNNTTLEYLSMTDAVPCEAAVCWLSQHPTLKHLNLITYSDSLSNEQFIQLLQSQSVEYLNVQGHELITCTEQVLEALQTTQVKQIVITMTELAKSQEVQHILSSCASRSVVITLSY